MRITPISWLIVLGGAVAFGGCIVGLARVLPTDPPRDAASIAPGAHTASPQVPPPTDAAGATPAPSPDIGLPPAAAREPIAAYNFRPVDTALRDRYGNPRKRAATLDELLAIAASYDIIVDDLRWQPDGAEISAAQISAMKAVNPRLRVLRYLGVLTNNDGPILNIAPEDGEHGSLFLRDGSGDFVRAYEETAPWDGKPSYAFDPASVDVRNNISAWARQFSKMEYDGILLGGVSACAPAPATSCAGAPLLSAPLDKTTNRPYTDAAWREATIGLLASIRHNAPGAAIFIAGTAADAAAFGSSVDGAVVLRAP